ncbi:MAG: SNF2-related protein [Prolixibacteraceae bacterium]|jgi:superfamily II DNA or RNA helicase|nr:SNF2-related protein [Prolixibacteraceae bacterium]
MPAPQLFVVTLAKHRIFGQLLYPYFAEQIPGEPYLRLLRRVKLRDINDPAIKLSALESRLVKISERYSDESLIRKYCPDKPVRELINMIGKEEVKHKVLSHIENAIAEILELLKKEPMPLYQKREKYANLYDEDLVSLCYQDTGAVFNFTRLEEETRYFLTLRNGKDGFALMNKNFELLVNEPCRIYYQNKIYFFDEISASKLLPFREKEYISVPRKMEDRYYETFILNAIKCHEVKVSGFEIRETIPEKGTILSLESDLSGLPLFVLQFTYNGVRLKMKQGEQRVVVLQKHGDQYVFEAFSRDQPWEKRQFDLLKSLGLDGVDDNLRLESVNQDHLGGEIYHAISWIKQYSKILDHSGIVMAQPGMAHPYFLGNHEMQISAGNKIDWFDLDISIRIGEWSFPFIRFKRLILNEIREFKLPNGEIFILPEEWFAQFSEILALGKAEGSKILLKPSHFMLLSEQFIAINPDLQQRISQMDSHQMMEHEIPDTIQAKLRKYQYDGYNWLMHLWKNGLNGCLADDMGLGKTLQTLILLAKHKRKVVTDYFLPPDSKGQLSLFPEKGRLTDEVQPASLIVLPVSLLHNWENEIRKFAPTLKVYTYSGVKRREKVDFAQLIHYYDLVLTTYGTVRNDSEVLAKHSFFYLILDESQNIKNAESKSYKAVCAIPSKFRLSLTGTPIENSLSDLWSQMNFLNPGQLGSFKFFKDNYLVPIEKERNEEATARLNRLIEPFVLRRTKEQVAADLPPVMEELLTITMTVEQQEFYEAEKSSVRNYLLKNIDELEPRNTTFVVLQALTRLRQIAIHPRLVDSASIIESGKFNEILSMLEVLVAENHKILVFSSFVKHLNLLEESCRNKEWGYCRLTGQTTDRKTVISEFQSKEDKNIFLISLKAGGVGLNLTAADYIFIIDPWWNPAAEMQAISRAHRIGQDKKVFVYRFISENSIEEKIQLLQEKKASLANEFINHKDPFSIFGKEELIQLFD